VIEVLVDVMILKRVPRISNRRAVDHVAAYRV
jgi:hypothetical protein